MNKRRHQNHESIRSQFLIAIALHAVVAFTTTIGRAGDPLSSWNDGNVKPLAAAKQAPLTKE